MPDKVVALHVVVRSVSGKMTEKGDAVREGKAWRYDMSRAIPAGERFAVEATAAERLGKVVQRAITLQAR